MRNVKQMVPLPIKAFFRRLLLTKKRYQVNLHPRSGVNRGSVLFSYLADPIKLPEDSAIVQQHTGIWSSREIARIFVDLGFRVDGVNWNDRAFVPKRHYEVVFDIADNLARWETVLDRQAIKFLNLTGSNPHYAYESDSARVAALLQRRGGHYAQKRRTSSAQSVLRSLELADACSLVGNDYTWQTYPQAQRSKLVCVPVSTIPFPAI